MKSQMHIKICGITNLDDAIAATTLGADHLGFNFYARSPRFILSEECAQIVVALREQSPAVFLIGVFVNHPEGEIAQIMRNCRLDAAQLSGNESARDVEALAAHRIRAFKALRSPLDAQMAASYAQGTRGLPALLVDGGGPGQFGGTGEEANWDEAAIIAKDHPVFLAGGLTPDNVGAAICRVHPWGVDTASGVEVSPGKKDREKIKAFIQAARRSVQAVTFTEASPAEAAEILALQKLAYQSEAELNDDFSIPPLTQTLEEIREEFGKSIVLIAGAEEKIIGSVRAHMEGGFCLIGRLIVHPDWQNQGIGGRLLDKIELHFPRTRLYSLFTGVRSKRNLYFYRKHGYKESHRTALNDKTPIVFLEKAGPDAT
jgi:phosphoribosylanthranilate isomerase